jgi:sec-independent protein translocase protein TatB
MFDVGWSEMAIIAFVALLVIGPKELPNALKTFAHWMKQARKMAREFQSGVDEIVREAELEEARKALNSVSGRNLNQMLEKAIDPTGDVKKSLNEMPTKPAPAVGPGVPVGGISAATPATPTAPAPAPAEHPALSGAAAAPSEEKPA